VRSVYCLTACFSAIALACGGDPPTRPEQQLIDTDVRISGTVLWRDSTPAVGVSVLLREFSCDASRSLKTWDLGCQSPIIGSDITDAEGHYAAAGVAKCPRPISAYAQARTNVTSPHEEVACQPGDQQFDFVIRGLPEPSTSDWR